LFLTIIIIIIITFTREGPVGFHQPFLTILLPFVGQLFSRYMENWEFGFVFDGPMVNWPNTSLAPGRSPCLDASFH
jgi:hypothetical protein